MQSPLWSVCLLPSESHTRVPQEKVVRDTGMALTLGSSFKHMTWQDAQDPQMLDFKPSPKHGRTQQHVSGSRVPLPFGYLSSVRDCNL